jgi:hypothetical protein
MDRQSKFDQEIRKKMLPLEDEPSAAVWAGIRGTIGPALPPPAGKPLLYQILVAASVALLATLAFLMIRKNQHESRDIAKDSKYEVTVPTQRPATEKGDFATQTPTRNEVQQPQHQPWYGPAYPETRESLADEDGGQPIPELRQKPEIKEKPEQFVDRAPRLPEKKPLPQYVPAPVQDHKKMMASNENPAEDKPSGKKRRFRLPKAEDLTLANLKEKSKGVLASLASGAGTILGIDNEIRQSDEEDLRTTAFSANFGLFKVKKVQTVKTKNP